MSGLVLVVASSLAVFALLAFAVSLVAFLVQTSRHKPTRGWAMATAPSVEGRSTVRLIGMDTPEVHFGTQPYGPEASTFAKRQLEGEEVSLELVVQKIDPYGRLLAYVYLPEGQMFNETLLEEGYAQVVTF